MSKKPNIETAKFGIQQQGRAPNIPAADDQESPVPQECDLKKVLEPEVLDL